MTPNRPSNLIGTIGTGYWSMVGLHLDRTRHYDLDLIGEQTIDAPERIPAGSTEAAGMAGGRMRATATWVVR